MTAASDAFKDIVLSSSTLPFPRPRFTMFAPAQILISFRECAAATVEQPRTKNSLGSITSDPEADGFADQLQHWPEPEGPDHSLQS